MKKLMKILGAILFVSTIIWGYNIYSIDSDAKKVAKMECELYQTQDSEGVYDNQMGNIMKENKLEDLKLKIEIIKVKYTPYYENKRFYETLEKEMDNCK